MPSSSKASSPAPSLWEKTRDGASTGWSGLYKVADKVGFWANKQVAKIGMEAFYPTSLDIESTKAARILRTFTLDAPASDEAYVDRKKTQKVVRKIPPSAIENCAGLAIFTVFRTGFVWSGAGGSGVVIAKLEDGSWSAPSGILLHTLGWGLLAGADIYDVVLILRTPAALNTFTHPRVTIGGELSVTAGPVGNGVMLEGGIELSPVWSYIKSKGLYGGIQVDGNIVIERHDENARSYYRPGVKAKDILSGQVHPPLWCEGLHQTILAASGRLTARDKIPRGPSAGDFDLPPSPARRLPPEAEDYEDLVARAEMEESMKNFGIDDPAINLRRQSTDELLVREPPPAPPAVVESATAAPPRPPRRFVAPLPSRRQSPALTPPPPTIPENPVDPGSPKSTYDDFNTLQIPLVDHPESTYDDFNALQIPPVDHPPDYTEDVVESPAPRKSSDGIQSGSVV